MPLFEPDGVRALVGKRAEGERTLDLRGLSLTDAQSAVADMLNRSPSDEFTSVVVRIDSASATSGETHFLPIGRQLLTARKRGRIGHFHPLPAADGGGFYVELLRPIAKT